MIPKKIKVKLFTIEFFVIIKHRYRIICVKYLSCIDNWNPKYTNDNKDKNKHSASKQKFLFGGFRSNTGIDIHGKDG